MRYLSMLSSCLRIVSSVLDAWFFRCYFSFAALSELVDGLHSKCSVRDGVWVRVPEAVRVPRQACYASGRPTL